MNPAVERILCESVGRRLDAIKSLLTAPVPYLAPLMVGAAPLFFLHWLYQPIVRANPGLRAYKPPVATLMLPPLRQLESAGLAVTPSAASLADVAADFAQPGLQDAKPKVQQSAGNWHLIVSSHNLRIGTHTRAPAPTRSMKTAINDPGRSAGTNTRRRLRLCLRAGRKRPSPAVIRGRATRHPFDRQRPLGQSSRALR